MCTNSFTQARAEQSLAAAGGIRHFTIAALMGHSNVRTTQRYVRATERNKREAVQAAMLSSRGHNLATRERKAAAIVAVSA